jgi:hypothetical protein
LVETFTGAGGEMLIEEGVRHGVLITTIYLDTNGDRLGDAVIQFWGHVGDVLLLDGSIIE